MHLPPLSAAEQHFATLLPDLTPITLLAPCESSQAYHATTNRNEFSRTFLALTGAGPCHLQLTGILSSGCDLLLIAAVDGQDRASGYIFPEGTGQLEQVQMYPAGGVA